MRMPIKNYAISAPDFVSGSTDECTGEFTRFDFPSTSNDNGVTRVICEKDHLKGRFF